MLTLPAYAQSLAPQLGQIYHMDAIELLGRLPAASVDLIATDPPYGLGNRTFEADRSMGGKDNQQSGTYVAINEEWDKIAPVDWMAACHRVLKPGGSVVCCAAMGSVYEFAGEGLRLGWKLINDVTWKKPNPPPNFTGRAMHFATERILWFCPDGKNWTYNTAYARAVNGGVNLQDVWEFNVPHGEKRIHPSQKPVDMFERIVKLFSPLGGVVCDPFMGSGTTAIAALNSGREFVGCDVTAEYIDAALARVKAWRGIEKVSNNGHVQMGLFAASA